MNTICSRTGTATMRVAFALTSVAAATTLAYGQVGMENAILAAKEAPTGKAARNSTTGKKPSPVLIAKATPTTGHVEIAPQVNLSEGKSTLMRLPYPATRLSVGDAQVADVILLNPSELYMLGKSVGSTNLILWNKANDATIIDISVGIDTTALSSRFGQLLADEKDVKITTAADTLILSGTVSDVVRADQLLTLANAYVQRSSRSGHGAGASAGLMQPTGGAGKSVV